MGSQGEFSLTQEVAQGIRLDPADWPGSLARLQAHHRESPFYGLAATDDAVVEQTADIGQCLGLSCNPPSSARLTRRKDLARQHLRAAGVSVPDHRVISSNKNLTDQLKDVIYPIVLKPVSLSASQGVIRANDQDQALAACDVIQQIITNQEDEQEQVRILIEAYVPGQEVALEGLLHQGQLQMLALFDKPDPLEGPYFEETYYITPSRHPQVQQDRLLDMAAKACKAYGLHQGPVHVELRFDVDDVWVIEVASRTIGGECSRVLDACLERPLEQYVLAAALGEPLTFEQKGGASGVLMIPIPRPGVLRRINGEAAIRALPGITDLRISVSSGQVLQMLPKSASYLGFIFAHGQQPEEVEACLRQAHGLLDIVIDPLL